MHIISNEISISERESRLWLASNQYMRGEITLNTLEAVEQDYALAPSTSATRLRPTSKLRSSQGDFLSRYLKKAWLQLKKLLF